MAGGEALYHRCPPGGEDNLAKLTQILGQPVIPLDTSRHTHYPQARVAIIREDECIGCTKCIQACPVDAIIGAARQMHTVIADECTGCDLCVDPCPVDCIEMVPVETSIKEWQWQKPIPAEQAIRLIATDRNGGDTGKAA